MEKIFEAFYRLDHFYDAESKSGPGSNLRQTATVRNILPTVLKEFKINTILDIPCGDFNWMKEVDLDNCWYTGADIVRDIVQSNYSNYSDDKKNFIWADITTSDLSKVDLILCRDCLVHFSNRDITRALINIKRSKSKYLLTTTFLKRNNQDIETGGWRPINLESQPFLFPAPLRIFNENCTEDDGRYSDKSLALWTIENLPE
jgi:2-polyprenyl-3-methyl-5-hydroxy-6-metoxy-1,4-benzoquinol methylase